MNREPCFSCYNLRRLIYYIVFIALTLPPRAITSQTSAPPGMQSRIQTLTEAIDRVEEQLQQSQQELAALKEQLQALQSSSGAVSVPPPQTSRASALAEAVDNLRNSEAMNQTQIATLQQTKVESASKYPLRVSGLVLMTGFVNTQRVDVAQTPSVALSGSGSTGATMQHTILGLDAFGPHLLGASSRADLRFDFDGGNASSVSASGYSSPLIRLRTAHAEMNWDHTVAYFAQDHSMLSPDSPTSVAAVALPPLSWSGNLWSWIPQVGASHDLFPIRSGVLRFQAALADVADPPPLFAPAATGTYIPPSSGELSRWPGVEGRTAFESGDGDGGSRLGLSGFFAPHRASASGFRYESWAGATDFRLPVTRLMQLSGGAYYGAGLGSLGGGGYKNAVLRSDSGEIYFRALDDIGGWAQWKQRTGERLEFNEAFGIDNVPAGQLRPFAIQTPISYYNLARNRTFTGNVIYSPSAYLLFSLEYRRIASSYVTSPTQSSDVINIVAGYKF
jgi:hypothetical protein